RKKGRRARLLVLVLVLAVIAGVTGGAYWSTAAYVPSGRTGPGGGRPGAPHTVVRGLAGPGGGHRGRP
ncbi:hypothetical protein ACWDP9_31550, partial [Streptomyces nigra]